MIELTASELVDIAQEERRITNAKYKPLLDVLKPYVDVEALPKQVIEEYHKLKGEECCLKTLSTLL